METMTGSELIKLAKNPVLNKFVNVEEGQWMDSVLLTVTQEEMGEWITPAFQRDAINPSKSAVAQEFIERLEHSGKIATTFQLAIVRDKNSEFKGQILHIDGQQRRVSAESSQVAKIAVPTEIRVFDTDERMLRHYKVIQKKMKNPRPDDILRADALDDVPLLLILLKNCPFVSYSRATGDETYVASLGEVIRSHFGAMQEAPEPGWGSATELAHLLKKEDVAIMSKVLNLLYEVWGHEKGTSHLWNGKNVILLEWLYVNTVLAPYHQGKGGKTTQLTEEQFKMGVLQMKIDGVEYHKATKGYPLNEAQRSYLYGVIWVIFRFAFYINGEENITLPKPGWSNDYAKQLKAKIKSFEGTQMLQRQKPVKEAAQVELIPLPRPPVVLSQGMKRRTAEEVAARSVPVAAPAATFKWGAK